MARKTLCQAAFCFLRHFKTEALQDMTQFFAFIIKWEKNLICSIVTLPSQKCFNERSQCWVNPRPHSTTFIYRKIILSFNAPNKTFLTSSEVSPIIFPVVGMLLNKLHLFLDKTSPNLHKNKWASTGVTEVFTHHHHLMYHCCLSLNPHSPEQVWKCCFSRG